jgi:hypothetical protein
MYVYVYLVVGGSAVAGEEEDLWRVLDPHDGSAYAVRPLKKGVFLCMCLCVCTLSLFTHTRAHTHRSHGAASIYAIKVFAGCHVDRPVGQADALAQSTFAAGVFRSLSPGAQYIYVYICNRLLRSLSLAAMCVICEYVYITATHTRILSAGAQPHLTPSSRRCQGIYIHVNIFTYVYIHTYIYVYIKARGGRVSLACSKAAGGMVTSRIMQLLDVEDDDYELPSAGAYEGGGMEDCDDMSDDGGGVVEGGDFGDEGEGNGEEVVYGAGTPRKSLGLGVIGGNIYIYTCNTYFIYAPSAEEPWSGREWQ